MFTWVSDLGSSKSNSLGIPYKAQISAKSFEPSMDQYASGSEFSGPMHPLARFLGFFDLTFPKSLSDNDLSISELTKKNEERREATRKAKRKNEKTHLRIRKR